MPRIILGFSLSGPEVQQNLLHEFSLHHDVAASARDDCVILVETSDLPAAVWEVRATIGMFDDRATEITGQT
ncbi:MAG: hypothetical protein ABWY50_01740 [Aeromicrobium sp.]